MKISYNWMKDFVALNKTTDDGSFPEPEVFVKKIFEAGYDIENIKHLTERDGVSQDDTVIDIRIPRNRSDLTAMHWQAKDLCGVYRRYFRQFATYAMHGPSKSYFNDLLPTDLNFSSTTKECKMLFGQIVRRIENLESPAWLKNFVIANGYPSKGTLFDVPIYETRNLGQPCYALDLDKLESHTFIVEEAKENGSIVCDGKDCTYEKGDALITNNGKVISIYGVVFDDSVVVTNETKSVLFFSAIFNRENVIKTIERLKPANKNLNNIVASIGLAPSDCIRTVNHAIAWCNDISNASGFEKGDLYCKYDTSRKFLSTSVEEINGFLSTDFTGEEIQTALNNAELNTSITEGNLMNTAFPSYRQDRKACDIAQTILSYLGCNRIGILDEEGKYEA